MVNIQYVHRNPYNDYWSVAGWYGTWAFETPTEEQLQNKLDRFIYGHHSLFHINLRCGYAKLAKKDPFVKSIGRELSSERISSREFTLRTVTIHDDEITFYVNNVELSHETFQIIFNKRTKQVMIL